VNLGVLTKEDHSVHGENDSLVHLEEVRARKGVRFGAPPTPRLVDAGRNSAMTTRRSGWYRTVMPSSV